MATGKRHDVGFSERDLKDCLFLGHAYLAHATYAAESKQLQKICVPAGWPRGYKLPAAVLVSKSQQAGNDFFYFSKDFFHKILASNYLQ